jgi:hypothetical protein
MLRRLERIYLGLVKTEVKPNDKTIGKRKASSHDGLEDTR